MNPQINSISQHAAVRMNQRGISQIQIDLIAKLGVEVERPGNAILQFIPREVISQEKAKLKMQLKALEKIEGKAVVKSVDEVIITTMQMRDKAIRYRQ